MDPMIIAAIGCLVLLVLLASGIPVAFCLAIAGLIGLGMLKGSVGILDILMAQPYAKVTVYTLSVICMFVLMGQMAFVSGISRNAFDASRKLMARIPGAIGVSTIAACAIFGAACGSSMASAAAMGKVAIPEMRKAGYDKKLAAGIVAAGGMLAWLIPPSVALAIYGIITEVSIGKLLIAGFLPGVLTAFNFIVFIVILGIVKPQFAGRDMVRYSWKEKLSALPKFFPVLVLFIVVMGGIYCGVFTPTEAGAVGALAAFVFALIGVKRGHSSWAAIKKGLFETVEMSSMMFMLFIGASLFSFFIAMAGLPQLLQDFVSSSGMSPAMLILLICLAYIPLGMFLEPMSIQLLTLPIVFPIIIQMGFSGIWFGIVICKLLEIAMLTPPIGLNVYVIKGLVPDMKLEEAFWGVTPFVVLEVITLVILILFPQISLWLPGLMME